MTEELGFLRNVPIFADLDDIQLDKIAKLGTRKKYKKGNIIVSKRRWVLPCLSLSPGK